jgi:hypothetical protein
MIKNKKICILTFIENTFINSKNTFYNDINSGNGGKEL